MHATPALRAYSLIPIALVLAFFFHPSDQWWSVQITKNTTHEGPIVIGIHLSSQSS